MKIRTKEEQKKLAIITSAGLLIYALINNLIVAKWASETISWRTTSWFLILTGATILFFIIVAKDKSIGTTRITYTILATIFGVIMTAGPISVLFWILKETGIIITKDAKYWVAIVIILTIYGIINALIIRTNKIKIKINNLKEKTRIAQISDVHIGVVRGPRLIKRIAKIIEKNDPDIITITGDLLDGSDHPKKEWFEPLKKIAEKKPVIMVMGNHERYFGLEKAEELLKGTNITILRNKEKIIKNISFVGTDCEEIDHWSMKNERLAEMSLKNHKPRILLYHTPSGFNEAINAGTDLMLSGHTHGGQSFPFTLIIRTYYPYVKGLHKIKNMWLYINKGTGTWGPLMRLGAAPEITIIELEPKN